MRIARVLGLGSLAVTSLVACRRTDGARPIGAAHPAFALGAAPVTASPVIDVGVSDVRLLMDEPQPVLVTNVGSVQFRLDGRELHHGKSPGAGDQLRLGDLNALPGLDVSTGVGSIRAEFNTRKPDARNEH